MKMLSLDKNCEVAVLKFSKGNQIVFSTEKDATDFLLDNEYLKHLRSDRGWINDMGDEVKVYVMQTMTYR